MFGGINILLLGDVAQLPPVSDRVLWHSNPTNIVSTSGYIAYSNFDKVVQLTENHRAGGTDLKQQTFRKILLNLRNRNNTIKD